MTALLLLLSIFWGEVIDIYLYFLYLLFISLIYRRRSGDGVNF